MTAVIAVPQTITGCPVVAAIAVAPRPGEPPFEFIVICQHDRTQPGVGPYVTWRVGTCDGREWTAEHPVPGLTWPQAVASFASRASLPAPGSTPGPAGAWAAE